MPQLADIHNCTGCMACVDSCPRLALSSVINDEGHLTYRVNNEICVECGLCESVCPVVSTFSYGKNVLSNSQPYAAWAKDNALRAKSTSGGVFAALAKYILSKGGVVVGACLENNVVRHVLIEKEEEIVRLQGSKYTQSNTEGVYKAIKKTLTIGRTVLFSGLGCQVAGLLSYLGGKEYKGSLFTVDLICGGVPSRFLIDYYLKHNPIVDEIVAFRNKSKYEFSVKERDGIVKRVPISERPLPLCGFYTELTNRYSCYDCHFNGAHRKSDITIGDYWGDKDYQEEHTKGLSIAVSHSTNGSLLLQSADIVTHETDWDVFLLNNPRMIDGHKNHSKTRARKNLAKAFKYFSYERILQEYANKATWHDPYIMLRKIIRHFIGSVRNYFYRIKIKILIRRLIEK